MLKHFLVASWRSIKKNKTASVINILGLTLGFTACLVVYLDTHFELSFDTFHMNRERIYRVVTQSKDNSGEIKYKATVPDPMAAVMKTEFAGLEQVVQFHNYYAKVSVPDGRNTEKIFYAANEREDEYSDILISDPGYFDLFTYEWLAGNPALMNKPFQVVLTEQKARKYFGNHPLTDLPGKEIIYNDSLHVTVAGIVKNLPANSDFKFNDFISSATIQQSFLKSGFDFTNWERWNKISQTFVKLQKGSTPAQFEKQTLGLVKKYMNVGNGISIRISLQQLADMHFNADYSAAYGREVNLSSLYGLMAIALFILVVAAVNFINLATAQSMQRAKAIAVRKVMGSRRSQLVMQFLVETSIFTLLAMGLSFILLSPVIHAFHAFLPEGIAMTFSACTISFIVSIAVVISLLAGFYPGRILSAGLPVVTLKGSADARGNGKNYLRKGLIIFQFTISLVFIIATLLVGNQVKYMLTKDMGFSQDAILNIPGNSHYPKEKMQVLAQRIAQISGIEKVSIDLGTPAEKSHWSTLLKTTNTGDEGIGAEFQAGDTNYARLYDLKFLAGRNLLASDTMKEYLINETLARQLGFARPEDALGKTISSGGDDGTTAHKKLPIVGVLADFHSTSLHSPIAPTFISTSKKYSRMISVKLTTGMELHGSIKTVLEKIETAWQQVYPDEKFQYKFFDETIRKFYEAEEKTRLLVNTAMCIAIFISCMGLFGLSFYEAQKRTKEIGIRKVMGAGVAQIVSLFSMNFLYLILIAFVAAAPIAYYFMQRWLQNFQFRITISWTVFAISMLAALAIAFFTISFHAIKAARANPIDSLRAE